MASSIPSWSLPPPGILQRASTFRQWSQNQSDLSSSATKGPCRWGSRSSPTRRRHRTAPSCGNCPSLGREQGGR